MSVKLMMARQWIFNFKWLQACGPHRRRERRRRRIRRAADDSTCGWVDTRKQTTFAEEEGEWVVAGAGLGAVYPALSCSDIVESTLSLTERENFETFLWPVRHTRSSKTCPRPTKSGWAPLSSAACASLKVCNLHATHVSTYVARISIVPRNCQSPECCTRTSTRTQRRQQHRVQIS